jgi:hypothetical protein
LTSASSTLVINPVSPNIDLRANGIKSANGFVSLECGTDGSLFGTVDTAGTNPYFNINGNAGSEINIFASGDINLETVSARIDTNQNGTLLLRSMNSSDITLSTGNIPGGGQQIILSTGASPPATGLYVSPLKLYFNSVEVSPFSDSFQIYVAPNGVVATGTGSQQNPLSTVAQALLLRASLPNTSEVSIIVSSGTYNESPTLTRNTYLVGVQTGEARQPVNIVGNIVLNDTTGFMGLSGLDVSGTITTSGAGGTYTLFGCNITAGAANAVVGSAGTIFITECRISNTANTCIISSSSLTIRDCFITTGSASSAIFATSTFTVRQSVIQSSSTSATALALVRFGNTGSSTVEISFCKLEYTSTTTDTGGNKCCVQFAGTGASTASIYNNLLLCEGATTANGGGAIQCIQDTGTGAVNLSYGQLIAGATANHIASAITKTQYNSVP